MTKEQKYEAIVERLNEKKIDFDPTHISMMMIVGYLEDLAKAGIIQSAYSVTESGKSVRAICEEFDWKPEDKDIAGFVNEMVDKEEQVAFAFLIKKYRDDREGLMEEFNKFKITPQDPPTENN